MSDVLWRCSSEEENNWFESSFDDSSWSNAFVLPVNATEMLSLDALLTDFEAGAKLIWHFDYENVDTVYCRVRLCPGTVMLNEIGRAHV